MKNMSGARTKLPEEQAQNGKLCIREQFGVYKEK